MERRTAQRDSIQRVFARLNRPLSPQEVLAEARRQAPRLGLATVYRAIRGLLDDGHLHPVAVPGQAPRYEWCDATHHHYFHCTGCDQLFKLDGCADNIDRLAPRGFKIASHEIMLSGLCPACHGKPQAPSVA